VGPENDKHVIRGDGLDGRLRFILAHRSVFSRRPLRMEKNSEGPSLKGANERQTRVWRHRRGHATETHKLQPKRDVKGLPAIQNSSTVQKKRIQGCIL